ncbi:MAG: protein kinase [Desulfarculus sp.]|nr:protein kinase [Desulfarculus sp.]
MDYVEGRTLSDILAERGKLGENEALDIIRQITKGLAKAHSHNLVHRDIKPSNVMITSTGQVIVTDFGIAKDWTRETSITQFGVALGTPRYASPEQKAALKVDGRSDIYSLGVVMYEMVTGKTPSQVQTSASSQDPPPPPSQLEPSISDSYSALVLKALERRPEKRFASAEALLEILDRIIEGKSFHYIPTMPRQKKLALAGAAAGLLLVLLVGSWFAGGDKWVKSTFLTDPNTRAAQEQAARLTQESQKARRELEEITQRAEKERRELRANALVEQGEQKAIKGDFAAARKLWEEALRVAPGFEPAGQALAAQAGREEEWRKARQVAARANSLVEQGEQKTNENDFAAARRLFNEALQLVPDLESARRALNGLPAREKAYAEIKKQLEQGRAGPQAGAKAQAPQLKTDDLLENADKFLKAGKYDQAISYGNLVQTMEPGSQRAKQLVEEARRKKAEGR